MKPINPFHHRMLFTSFSFLFMAMIAAYHDFDYLFFIDIGLFLTSVNYWRYPLKNWRRNIDIAMVVVAMCSHIYAVLENEKGVTLEYFLLALLIDGLYLTCKISDNRNLSAACHSIMHIVVVVLFIKIYESELSPRTSFFDPDFFFEFPSFEFF